MAGCLSLWTCFSCSWFEHTLELGISCTATVGIWDTSVIQTCFGFVPSFCLQVYISYNKIGGSSTTLSPQLLATISLRAVAELGTSLLLAELFGGALLVSVRRNGWVSQMEQVWQVCGAGRGWLRYLTACRTLSTHYGWLVSPMLGTFFPIRHCASSH